jgi:hypothetical protein
MSLFSTSLFLLSDLPDLSVMPLFMLRHTEPVALPILHDRFDAVEAVFGRTGELHALGLELLVGATAIVDLEDA